MKLGKLRHSQKHRNKVTKSKDAANNPTGDGKIFIRIPRWPLRDLCSGMRPDAIVEVWP